MAVSDYLTQLQEDKANLVSNLSDKGVEASDSDTFTELVPKVASIESGPAGASTIIERLCGKAGTSIAKGLLKGCTDTKFDLSDFGSLYIADTSEMFSGCENLIEVTLPNSLTVYETAENMFRNCYKLQKINNTINIGYSVTSLAGMFSNCYNLQDINNGEICGTNVTKVTDLSDMFKNCRSLTTLDLSDIISSPTFLGSSITNVDNMFNGCTRLKELNISTIDFSNVDNDPSLTGMFTGCQSLETIYVMDDTAQEFVQMCLDAEGLSAEIIVTSSGGSSGPIGPIGPSL